VPKMFIALEMQHNSKNILIKQQKKAFNEENLFQKIINEF
jgi:hypothetical protein